MAVKQYLFRLYHKPITEEFRNWSDVLQEDIQLTLNQFEIAYTDYPCSLPETTVDLSHQASMLAYCDALLTIQDEVWMIVVWQLSDEHGADHTTPVIVLHPYLHPNLAPYRVDGSDTTQYFPSFDYAGEFDPGPDGTGQGTGMGYPSYYLYDLSYGPNNNWQFPDPWTVAVIARDVERGRYQQQMFKRAIGVEDKFFSKERNYVLNMDGSLAKTRFPLWSAAMESLPNGHSGYSVNRDGKLIGQPKALTRRVLNGVSNLAQQRRMFIRRDWAVSAVAREWYITQKKFMAWFWFNDQWGYQTPEFGGNYHLPDGRDLTLTTTVVPFDYLQRNLAWLIDFLNLVNVAQGDTGLTLALPGLTAAELENEYTAILNKLRGPDGVVSRYSLATLTPHVETFRHAVDLTAHIIEQIIQFRSDLQNYSVLPPGNTTQERLEHDGIYTTILNNFALTWPSLVAEFYSVFCLLCTWHLTWNVSEKTRGSGADDVLRNKSYPYVQKWQRHYLRVQKFNIRQPPNMNYFLSTARPHFVPFRTWEVALFDTGYDYAAMELERQMFGEQQAQIAAEREQQRMQQQSDREAAAADYLARTRADRLARTLPNPDDVWDYRNNLSLEWWKQKSQEQLNLEFALRAIDVPNELFSPLGVGLGLVRNYIPAFSDQTDAAGFNARIIPAGSPISALGEPIVLVLITTVLGGVNSKTPFQIVGDVAGIAADYLGTNDETYSPRQFWPAQSWTW
jgi:hypothetical protein